MGLYAGDLRIAFESEAGQKLGFSPIIPTDSFKLNTPSELKQKLAKTRDGYNQPVFALPQAQQSSIGFKLLGNSLTAFRLQWIAAQTALSQTAGTVDADDGRITLAKGLAGRLPHRAVSNVVLAPMTGSTTYQEGVDYRVVNPRLGLIEAIPGSTLATAVDAADEDTGLILKTAYSYGAVAGTTLEAGKKPALYGEILFDGVELATQKDVTARVPRVLLRANGEVDLLSSDVVEVDIVGTPMLVPGETAPYYVDFLS
ncbi:hypothetical protein [Rubrivivax sp. JA1026]|uniref:phage tail tube protein n=1 Tax=Rubrivivax sp. JA1026 TaxID=2710888 RepID=UPI0013E99C13|nr:hypothetical protein [Rubrivivax sp. JA1026]